MQRVAAILHLQGLRFDPTTLERLEFEEVAHRNAGLVVREADKSLVLLFTTAKAAIICAVELRRRDRISSAEQKTAELLRGAISLGPVTIGQDDVNGDAMDIAASLVRLCEPGDILISGTCRDAVGDRLPVDYELLENTAFRLDVDDNEILSAIRHKNPVAPDWSWKVMLPMISMLIFIALSWIWFSMT